MIKQYRVKKKCDEETRVKHKKIFREIFLLGELERKTQSRWEEK